MPGQGLDTRSELTVFLITVGEPSFTDARQALEKQDCLFNLDVVWNVAPMSAAFQQMLDRCKTQYYIQVDADMVLKPHAVRTMYEAIRQTDGSKTAMLCWPLYDVHLERTLLGVKAYQHSIFRQYPYTDTQSCEMDQLSRLRADGYKFDVIWGKWSDHMGHLDKDDPRVLGLHGTKYTPRQAFERYRDLMQKARFIGGSDWVYSWPSRFLQRIAPDIDVETDENLWSLMGAAVGLMSDKSEVRGEKDYREYAKMKDYGEVAAHLVQPPKRLDVYTTSACNYACTFCRRQRVEKPSSAEFTVGMAERVLTTFPSISSACVAGFGEPLMAPGLPDLIDYFVERGVYTSLITNGFLIQDRLAEIAWKRLGYVNISLNAADPDTHEKRCGVPGAYSRAVNGLRLLLEHGANVGLSFVIDAENYTQIPKFLNFSKRQGAKFVSFVNVLPHHEPGDKASQAEFRNAVITSSTTGFASKMLEYKRTAQNLGVNVNAWPIPITPGNCPRNCRSPFIAIGVDGDGNLSGCCRIRGPHPSNGNIVRGELLWTELEYFRQLRRELSGAAPLRFPCNLCFGNWGGGT
jgi:MoaA/NifB/PqqE/SkfB family radical SAM enzyme